VAAPFLGSLAGREVKAQSSAPGRGFIAMFTYYGCITNRWFPEKSHGALAAADLEGTTLEPLVPYVDKLLLPRGIRSMNEWTMDVSLGQGNDFHTNVTGSYFTCQPLTPNSDEPVVFSDEIKMALPMGPSLDHVIAEQLSPDGAPLVMNVSGTTQYGYNAISFSAAQTIFPGIGNASQIFTQLTGVDLGSGSASAYQMSRGKSVLDLVKGDLETLEGFDMSRSDRDKLEAWKELLHETARACGSDLVTALELSAANLAAASAQAEATDRVSTKIEGTNLDGADVFSNLAVLAAACDASPAIVLRYPDNFVYSGLGITRDADTLAHRTGDSTMQGTCVPDVVDLLSVIDRFHAGKFAYLVGRLAELNDGDGSLLDQLAAVWFVDASDGGARNTNNLPILQAGSCGGYFKTGWAINVEDGSADLTGGNSEAVCALGGEAYNGTTKPTGTDPSIANAPINKYFCNLMNALGVKAGEDGFPAVGGTGEVTHFGRYDKTQDFIGGDVNPPTIHDPGEFTALRAGS